MSNRPTERPGSAGATGSRSYPESEVSHDGARYRLERSPDGTKQLVAEAADEAVLSGFSGQQETDGEGTRFVAPTTPENAEALRKALPWLTPTRFGLYTSVG